MMNPHPRGVVSDEDAERIRAAMGTRDDAQKALRAAVVTAMRHGASVREIAALTGLSTNTVSRWERDALR